LIFEKEIKCSFLFINDITLIVKSVTIFIFIFISISNNYFYLNTTREWVGVTVPEISFEKQKKSKTKQALKNSIQFKISFYFKAEGSL
jgi:hypothetical protein